MDSKLSLERLCIKLESQIRIIRETVELFPSQNEVISLLKHLETEINKLPPEHNHLYKIFTEELEKLTINLKVNKFIQENDRSEYINYFSSRQIREKANTDLHQKTAEALDQIGKFYNF